MKIEEIKVKSVDVEKLISFLNIPLKQNEGLSIEKFAIYKESFCIDTDSCFSEIHNGRVNGIVQPIINIGCRIKKYNANGGYSIRMDKHDFVETISLKEYLDMAFELPLTEFIRFNYNPRIESNQKLLMKYIKALALDPITEPVNSK